jgi:hypothetical protein
MSLTGAAKLLDISLATLSHDAKPSRWAVKTIWFTFGSPRCRKINDRFHCYDCTCLQAHALLSSQQSKLLLHKCNASTKRKYLFFLYVHLPPRTFAFPIFFFGNNNYLILVEGGRNCFGNLLIVIEGLHMIRSAVEIENQIEIQRASESRAHCYASANLNWVQTFFIAVFLRISMNSDEILFRSSSN